MSLVILTHGYVELPLLLGQLSGLLQQVLAPLLQLSLGQVCVHPGGYRDFELSDQRLVRRWPGLRLRGRCLTFAVTPFSKGGLDDLA